MNEKNSLADMLSSINASITGITYAIEQSNNKELRNILVAARSEFEDSQWSVYMLAKSKGFYVPAAPAGKADLQAVKKVINE